MIGPGQYDDLCTYVRETAKAEGAIVVIIEGEHGAGLSVQLTPELMLRVNVPHVLRVVADQIEAAHRDPPTVKTSEAAEVISRFDKP